MPERTLLIFGAGGHGKVIADCADSTGQWDAIAFCDERWPQLTAWAAWPVVGGPDGFFANALGDTSRIIGLGCNQTRLTAHDRVARSGGRLATVVSPWARVSGRAQIGAGTVVMPGAVINIGAVIGQACIINTGATVDHDCVLADGVHVSPGAHLAGNVRVGRASWIGIGSAIRQGIAIGAGSTVGAGAAVVADVPDDVVVAGVPARPLVRG